VKQWNTEEFIYLFIEIAVRHQLMELLSPLTQLTACTDLIRAREMCDVTSMEMACSYWNLLPVGDHPGSERRPVVAAPTDEHHPASIIFETIQLTINHI